jgi:hypothetical protein
MRMGRTKGYSGCIYEITKGKNPKVFPDKPFLVRNQNELSFHFLA